MKGLWWSLHFEFRKDVFIYRCIENVCFTFSKKFSQQANVVNKSISRKYYYALYRFHTQTLNLSSWTFCCVCVNHIRLCNYLCPSSSPSSRFSASLIRNIGEFGPKQIFTGHWTANTFKLFFPQKKKIFGSILFQKK